MVLDNRHLVCYDNFVKSIARDEAYMKEWFGKFLTCLAIALAVFFGINGVIETWKNTLICISILVVLLVVFFVVERISASDGNLLNAIRYFSEKDRTQDYTIIGREVKLEFKDDKQAEYTSIVHLKMKRTLTDFVYVGRYRWATQTKNIITTPISPSDSEINKQRYITNWTYLDIKSKKTLTKGTVWDTGFKLTDLEITDYKTQSFLCFKITDKIKTLKLIAKLPETEYGDKTATYYVWDASDQTIGSEIPLIYNKSIGGYEVQIDYPQLGRSYVIDWD